RESILRKEPRGFPAADVDRGRGHSELLDARRDPPASIDPCCSQSNRGRALMTAKTVFRIHPTINLARVGTSDDYYLSPETSAGLPTPGAGETVGGLPIKTGTEEEPITSDDLRDEDGHLRRQAARYRIFAYDFKPPDRYP